MDSSVHKIRAFVEAARLGSITRAAEGLGCTQSTVSRAISTLEAEWGVRLLDRQGSGVRATAEGSRLLADARTVCDAYDRLWLHAADLRGLESGAVSIAAPASIVARRLPAVIGAFSSTHPGIEVNVFESTYAEAERLLRAGGVDVAFLPTRLDAPDFESREFERDEIVVVAPRGRLPESPSEVALEDLAGVRLVVDTETAPLFQRSLTTPSIRCVTSDITAILSLVESGLGVSLLPSLALERQGFDVDVRHLKTPAWRTIYIATRPRASMTAAAVALVGHLL